MPPKIDLASANILNPFKANTMGFWQPYESHVPGEYLVTLDLAQIALDPATGLTQKALPFGVNLAFQTILDSLAVKSTLDYFAPLHANGFAYRIQLPAPVVTPALAALWNRSKIDPALAALQWVPESEESKRALARTYLQHMVMRFSDAVKGEEAVKVLDLRSLGIQQIEPMAARLIPSTQPGRIIGGGILIANDKTAFPSQPPPMRKEPGMKPPKIATQWWHAGVGINDRWRGLPKPSKRIQIAVFDTGCEVRHHHLKPVSSFINTIPNIPNSELDSDWNGHGTHVCGILLAKKPSSGDYLDDLTDGIGPDHFALTVYKVVADQQTGVGGSWEAPVSSSVYISALDHLLGSQKKSGADVRALNISLCGKAPFSTNSTNPERKKFEDLLNLGVIPVAAAGNGREMGNHVMYPACYKAVLSVGALEQDTSGGSPNKTKVWQFSNQGRANISKEDNTQKTADLYAPGVAIISTYVEVRGEKDNMTRNATAYEMSGTSMAAPIVSAAVAIKSVAVSPTRDSGTKKRILDWVEGLQSLNFSNL